MPGPGEVSPAFLEDPASAGVLPEWVLAYVRREQLFAPGNRVLVAVSGGPDSVALLHLLTRLHPFLSLDLGVAHYDHGLRGKPPGATRRLSPGWPKAWIFRAIWAGGM